MGVVALVARVELRRRWLSLVIIALLAAVVSGVVSTALVGARRSATSVERFREWAGASDASFQATSFDDEDTLFATLQGRPEVVAAAQRHLINAFIVDGAISDIAIISDPAGRFGIDIDRPRVLAGRLPDPSAPDEILLNELSARLTGLGVGDHLTVKTWSRDDLTALFDGSTFPGFNGPELDLTVVGVGRTLEDLPGDIKRTSPAALASSGFLGAHPDIGVWPTATFVRLRHGAADLPAVAAAVASDRRVADPASLNDPHYISATTASSVYGDTSQKAANGLATGLVLFAAGSAAAAALTLGQAVARQSAAASTTAETLSVLGLTASRTAWVLSLPIVVAGVLGVAAGAAAAIVASPLLPIGLARRAEVDGGIWVQPTILGLVAITVVVFLGFVAAITTRAGGETGARRADTGRRSSAGSRAAAVAGASPSVTVGLHLASERGRGPDAVPVRSAFLGIAIGVAAVMAAGVLTVSFGHLADEPPRWGWNWSSLPDYFGDGDPTVLEQRIVDDDRVAGVGSLATASVVVGDLPLTGYSMTALSGDMTITRRSGRLPSSSGEVALGTETMAELGIRLGDSLDVLERGVSSTRRMVVVGTVVLPPSEDYTLDVGAVFTPDTLDALRQDDPTTTIALRYPPGVEPSSLEAQLTSDYGLSFTVFAEPQTPGSIRNLAETRRIAVALAAFFAMLGGSGLLHALLVSTRRRRLQLAILRALGLSRRQLRVAILIQSTALGLAGSVVGIPVGLIAGRFVWHRLVDGLGVVSDPSTPWILILMTVPAVLVGVALLAAGPGLAAGRVEFGRELRPE